MTMPVLYGASPAEVAGLDTAALRRNFLIEGIFARDAARFVYTHVDRMLIGGAMPVEKTVAFGGGAEIGTEHLLSAREMGIANLGGAGTATVDGQPFEMANRDVLYVGRGAKEIVLSSVSGADPAKFYMNSVPAGRDIPHRLVKRGEGKPLDLGAARRANKRRLVMYIHPEVTPSCLLLMGITDLAEGSIWNTMPPHVHERRMEVYLYFDLAPEDRVVHLMGRPEETRHLIAADGDVVLSPSWSIHMGAGTGPYAFVWGMTGENQEYNDVDPVAVRDLK